MNWTLAIEEFSYLLMQRADHTAALRTLEPTLRRQCLPLLPALLVLIGVLIRITAVHTDHWQELSHSP